ncbi:hypothetical protein PtA15_9A664 [Puccinia triticina]|uniref:Uncharacterized protein n=1 Tax=Puccinia triticina TaxID=208348 RepID=A0ABY7CVQ9_9BASI|nr:uncharacterized protein PtA15_9A664 [Puccinia triticina]WAQ88537.1 hypothetical protein PtA15_9A664 [Puccinia triticina]
METEHKPIVDNIRWVKEQDKFLGEELEKFDRHMKVLVQARLYCLYADSELSIWASHQTARPPASPLFSAVNRVVPLLKCLGLDYLIDIDKYRISETGSLSGSVALHHSSRGAIKVKSTGFLLRLLAKLPLIRLCISPTNELRNSLLASGRAAMAENWAIGVRYLRESYHGPADDAKIQECHYASSILGWLRNPPSDASTFPGGQYFYQSQLAQFHLSAPPIKLSASNRPLRVDRGIGLGHEITQVCKNALKDIKLSVLWLTNQDPIISKPKFKAGTKGVPETMIRSNNQHPTLQEWLDCTSGEGKWRWQPTHDDPEPRPMTVHQQGSLEVKCERAFYERERAGSS